MRAGMHSIPPGDERLSILAFFFGDGCTDFASRQFGPGRRVTREAPKSTLGRRGNRFGHAASDMLSVSYLSPITTKREITTARAAVSKSIVLPEETRIKDGE